MVDKRGKCKHVAAVVPKSEDQYSFKFTNNKEKEFKKELYTRIRSRAKSLMHEHNEHCLEYSGSEKLRRQLQSAAELLARAQGRLSTEEDLSMRERLVAYIADRLPHVKRLGEEYTAAVTSEKDAQARVDSGVPLGPGVLAPGLKCRENHPFPDSPFCYRDEKTDRWFYCRQASLDKSEDDTMLDEFNAMIAVFWDAKHNLRLLSAGTYLEYVLKYVTKPEPVFDVTLLDSLPEEIKQYLKTEEGRHLHGRLMGSQEIVARMLGVPHIELSEGVLFLTTEMPDVRVRILNMPAVKRRAAEYAAQEPAEWVTADADVGYTRISSWF
jgi:hypothetical protein